MFCQLSVLWRHKTKISTYFSLNCNSICTLKDTLMIFLEVKRSTRLFNVILEVWNSLWAVFHVIWCIIKLYHFTKINFCSQSVVFFLYLIIINILWKPSWSMSLLQLSLLLSSLVKRACSKKSLNSGKVIPQGRKSTGNSLCCLSRHFFQFQQQKKSFKVQERMIAPPSPFSFEVKLEPKGK